MEACTDADEKGEALKYIPKLADPREKAEVIQGKYASLTLNFDFYIYSEIWVVDKSSYVKLVQAYARIGMAKEAADAASQAKDGELLARLKLTFAQNAAASSIFDTLRDRLSFPGA